MKKLILLTLVLVSHSFLSQSIQWGVYTKERGDIEYVVPDNGGDYYKITSSNPSGIKGASIRKLTFYENFIEKSSEKIVEKINDNKATLNDALLIDSKVAIFYTDKQDGVHKIFLQYYGKDCKPESTAKLITEFVIPRGWKKGGQFNVIQSKNGVFFCVNYSIPESKEGFENYGFKIIRASDLNEIATGEYESTYESKECFVSSRYLSNTGDYFTGTKVFDEKQRDRKSDNKVLKKFVFTHITNKGIDEFDLNLGEKRISDITFSSDNNQIITTTGLYGDGKKSCEGVFFCQFDFKTKEEIHKGFNKFGEQLIKEGMSERQQGKVDDKSSSNNEIELLNYNVRENITLEDGSIIGIMEQYKGAPVPESPSSSSSHMRFTGSTSSGPVIAAGNSGGGGPAVGSVPSGAGSTTYSYDDVIVYKINPQGEFEWTKKIIKNQKTTDDYGYHSSISTYATTDNVVVLFTDNIKNYSETGEYIRQKKQSNLTNTALLPKYQCTVKVTFDIKTGDMTRKILFTTKESVSMAAPKYFKVNEKNKELLLYLGGKMAVMDISQ